MASATDLRIFDNGLQELSEQLELSQQRCFMYGDGHFTTAKIKAGVIEHLALHIDRLKVAHKQLKMNPLLWNKLASTMQDMAMPHQLAVIKVQISRGQAVRGYGLTQRTSPAIFISVSSLPDDFEQSAQQSIELPLLTTQLAKQPLLAGIKHCNRLEQVLIANELETMGAEDGVVLDLSGDLIETSKANIFCYCQGKWLTPDLSNSGVAGVMREYILANTDAQAAILSFAQIIADAESAFICNSLIGIKPVSTLVGKPMNTQLVELFNKELMHE